MIKSSTKLLKKNKSQEDILLAQNEKQEMNKYDTNKIFEEFKKHMFKQDKKQKNKNFTMENSYKDLLCSVRKSNAEKKHKLLKIASRYQIIKKDSVTLRSKSSYKFNNYFQTHRQDQKRQKTEQFVESPMNPVESYCKFKPIRPMTTDNKFRLGSGSKSKVLENRTPSRLTSQVSRVLSPNTNSFSNLELSQMRKTQTTIFQHSAQKSLPEISESIMMVQQEETKLQQQISSLSQSMNKLTKELATLKKQLQIQERNQKKYKHISNLTTSIKNETEYIKQQNIKGLTSMISRQDETIANLKKFKMSLRKEKDQMESDYIEGINKFLKLQEEKNANKQKEMLFMATYMPNEKINRQNNLKQLVDLIIEEKAHKQKGLKFQLIKKYNSTIQRKPQSHQTPRNALANTKLIKKLIDELDSIIELFQQKQPSFEALKQQQCTRVRLGKINKLLLPKPRIQILQKIEQFEQKYDMKIVSVSNLMMRIYLLLTDENERLEADCLKLTQSKEESNIELKKIMEKHGMQIESHLKEDKLLAQELLRQKKLNSIIKQNSWVFLKIIQGFYNILLKYRHMFSLALTLDVDKNQFKETVIQIDSLFSEGLLAGFGTQKTLLSGNERHIVINQYWFRESLKEKEIEEPFIRQLIDMMFNDHRVSLMIKKIWVQSYLALIPENMVGKETQVLHIVETIHNDCSQMYQLKLPTISSLFLKCFKSLQMTKYESKLAASSSQSGEIFLLNRPVKRFFDPEFILDKQQSLDKQYENFSQQNSKKKITDVSETSTTQEDDLEKNPMKIIFNLEAIKNKGHKKFKALNFSCSGKAYKYNEAIIIPNFNMINKSEDI